jgi:hypothetical protein
MVKAEHSPLEEWVLAQSPVRGLNIRVVIPLMETMVVAAEEVAGILEAALVVALMEEKVEAVADLVI